MFFSGNFIYNNRYSKDYDIYLVYESDEILNEYGINFNENKEITLSLCLIDINGSPFPWSNEMLELVHEWFITDDFCEFISEDDSEYIYFLKGNSITKKLDNEMKGILEVTFELMDNYSYKQQLITLNNTQKNINILNPSNVSSYKPKIELFNINSSSIIITNTTNNKSLEINNIDSSANIFIDNKIGTIFNSKNKNLITNSNRGWLVLEKGFNNIKITGDCSIKFMAMYPFMR